jgi:hypothetical protein
MVLNNTAEGRLEILFTTTLMKAVIIWFMFSIRLRLTDRVPNEK